MMLHQHLGLRHCEVHSAKLGDLLTDFRPASIGWDSTKLKLFCIFISNFYLVILLLDLAKILTVGGYHPVQFIPSYLQSGELPGCR
jgi:hypothetical protein